MFNQSLDVKSCVDGWHVSASVVCDLRLSRYFYHDGSRLASLV